MIMTTKKAKAFSKNAQQEGYEEGYEKGYGAGYKAGIEFVLQELLDNEMILHNLDKEAGAAMKLYVRSDDYKKVQELVSTFLANSEFGLFDSDTDGGKNTSKDYGRFTR